MALLGNQGSQHPNNWHLSRVVTFGTMLTLVTGLVIGASAWGTLSAQVQENKKTLDERAGPITRIVALEEQINSLRRELSATRGDNMETRRAINELVRVLVRAQQADPR